MQRYHFHVDGSSRDEEGSDIENLAKAKCEAVEMAGRLICEESSSFWDKKEWGMTVTNGDDLALFRLTFYATESAAIAGR